MIKYKVSAVAAEREEGGNSDGQGLLENSRAVCKNSKIKPSDLEMWLGELYSKEIPKGRKRHLYEDIVAVLL